MERKVALITGITGQDGSYLSEFLLAKGSGALVRSHGQSEYLEKPEEIFNPKKY